MANTWQTTLSKPIEPPPVFEGGALHAALTQLESWELGPHQLSRVSLDSDGTLQLEAERAGTLAWFHYASGHLCRAYPKDDKKIPLLSSRLVRPLPGVMKVISYRPGRRVVLASTGPGDRSIIKGFRKGRGPLAFKHHEIAMRACQEGFFRVPNLLDHDGKHDFVAMERQAGSTPAIAAENASTWASVGAGLRSFQDSCDCTELRVFSRVDELAVLDEMARRFRLCALDLPPAWQAGRESLGSLAARLPKTRIAATHRDLHDGQFLASGDRLHVLDFDLLCKADTALDAGNLIAHMVLRDLQRDPESSFSASWICSKAFLSGLERHRDKGFGPTLSFYQATTFYRLALVYTLRPRWRHLVPSLVQLGQQQIARVKDRVFQG
jgi:hypothetical protein